MKHISRTPLSVILAGSIALCSAANASVLFEETFNTDPDGNLNGRTVESPQDGAYDLWWQSGGQSTVSNGALVLDVGNGTFSKATAGFDGNDLSFSLTYDISIAANQMSDNGAFYTGLGNSAGDGGGSQNSNNGFVDNTLSYGFKIRGDFNSGTELNVFTGVGPAENSINDFTATWTRSSTDDAWLTSVQIDVDSQNDTVDYYLGGEFIGQTERSITDIGGIWTKFEGSNDGVVTFDNFQVTTAAVPEPSSTALLGLSGLAFLLRRKR